jgi:hypothetical protein
MCIKLNTHTVVMVSSRTLRKKKLFYLNERYLYYIKFDKD